MQSGLFGHCEFCGACCHKPHQLELTREEQRRFNQPYNYIELKDKPCPFLGEAGCTLKHAEKPFVCRAFPLWVRRGKLTFYPWCPLLPKYLVDVQQQGTEVREHYEAIEREMKALIEATDPVLVLLNEELDTYEIPCIITLDLVEE